MMSKLKPKINFGGSKSSRDNSPKSAPVVAQNPLAAGLPPPTAQVPASSSNQDQNEEDEVSRRRVGRESNRLARREASKSNTLKTIESILSTASQADYFLPAQTVIVFDWDDTLCPSHWIRINRPKLHYFQPCPNDPKYKKPLAELEPAVIRVLRRASELGKVVILTNAAPQWVEISSRNFLPGVWPVIQELNIPINYARVQGVEQDVATSKKAFEYNYNVNIPQTWKERAFHYELTQFYSRYMHQSWKNIVSIGDQICERDACRLVTMNRPSQKKKCRTKTIKLLEEPSPEDITAELHVILQWLPGVVNYDADLDVDLGEDDDVIFELHQQLVQQS